MPENEQQALILLKTAEKNHKPCHEYVFGPNIPLQAQLDIDAIITIIGCEVEADELEQQQAESGNSKLDEMFKE